MGSIGAAESEAAKNTVFGRRDEASDMDKTFACPA